MQHAGGQGHPKRPVDAYEDALRILESRSRTTAELRQRLLRRGHEAADIDATLDRLSNVGLLNDDAYARQFARTRLAAGRAAPSRVQRDLVRRGVDRRKAAAALEEVVADEAVDVTSMLDDLVRRRAITLAKLDPVTRRRRLYGYLARRGFNADDISRALRARESSEAESRE